MGAVQGAPYGHPLYPAGSSHLVGHLQAKSSSQGPLPMIAPKPPPSYDYGAHQNTHFGPYVHGQSISPTSYNFNQTPANPVPYPLSQPPPQRQQSNVLVSPPSQPGYVKVHHDPRRHQHHFNQPPHEHIVPVRSARPAQSETLIKKEPDEVIKPLDSTLDYELPEDDASMGESDDETEDPREFLGPVVQRFTGTWDSNGTRVRAFSTFAQCNALSDYTASAQIRELKDPRMLAIFMHFIKVTGPSMSLYERHPFDHGDDNQFSKGANNLWTCKYIGYHSPTLTEDQLTSSYRYIPPHICQSSRIASCNAGVG